MNELRPGPLAIISDIHGNLDALAVVLKDVAANCCRSMICLGDIIGYGPEPGECVRLVREYANNTVTGNHEEMFLAMLAEGPRQREKSNDLWRPLALCRKALTPADRKWIWRLPPSLRRVDGGAVHGGEGSVAEVGKRGEVKLQRAGCITTSVLPFGRRQPAVDGS